MMMRFFSRSGRNADRKDADYVILIKYLVVHATPISMVSRIKRPFSAQRYS